MPLYNYQFLDEHGEPLDEFTEILHSIFDEALTVDPKTGRKVRRVLASFQVRDSTPAWERCSEIKKHVQKTRPKNLNDHERGISEKFDPRKHG